MKTFILLVSLTTHQKYKPGDAGFSQVYLYLWFWDKELIKYFDKMLSYWIILIHEFRFKYFISHKISLWWCFMNVVIKRYVGCRFLMNCLWNLSCLSLLLWNKRISLIFHGWICLLCLAGITKSFQSIFDSPKICVDFSPL